MIRTESIQIAQDNLPVSTIGLNSASCNVTYSQVSEAVGCILPAPAPALDLYVLIVIPFTSVSVMNST